MRKEIPSSNFQLDGYEVIGNIINSAGEAIHCWRMSANGLVAATSASTTTPGDAW